MRTQAAAAKPALPATTALLSPWPAKSAGPGISWEGV